MSREDNKARDKDRPVIVHCIALLVQKSTHCDDDDAVDAAWNIWDYLGQPSRLDAVSDQVATLRASLAQAVAYADVVAREDGMPDGKQCKRLWAKEITLGGTATVKFDVAAARALLKP